MLFVETRDITCVTKPLYRRRMKLQWHITDRCNLRCKHCYQETYKSKEFAFDELIGIMDQFKDLIEFWRARSNGDRVRGHITITGGEPFIRTDLMDLLEVIHGDRDHFSYAILSNGSYLTEELVAHVKALEPEFIQLSLEGKRETHDTIRGAGNFDRTLKAVKLLKKGKIKTIISFTAHRHNYREFADVARLGRRMGVHAVWADRIIPCSGGSKLEEPSLDPDGARALFEVMAKARKEAGRNPFSSTDIRMNRALQFLIGGGPPYRCSAGDSLLTVMPNGDVYPCRRMPVFVGNLLEKELKSIYYENPILRKLRDPARISRGCAGCVFDRSCRGGLRCLSYAGTGDAFNADPGCWLAAEDPETVGSNLIKQILKVK